MAQVLKPKRSPLPPLLRKNGAPLLKHDPGELPIDSNMIPKGGRKRPQIPPSHTKNATPVAFGSEIYMYSHIHTNQVLYSLTRHLSNKRSMPQLAFFGKKTQPAHLRKDLWLPVCLAKFPTASAGNEAFKRLQEYKRLHETAYPIDLITEKEGRRVGQLMVQKKRAKVLMNQKGNSIADLAEVLRHWTLKPPSLRREITESMDKERKKTVLRNRERFLRKNRAKLEKWERVRQKEGEEKAGPKPTNWENEERTLKGVEIKWADLRDADFVERWPAEVVHDTLMRSNYTAAWPVKKVEGLDENTQEDEAQAEKKDAVEAKKSDEDVKAKKPWYRRLMSSI